LYGGGLAEEPAGWPARPPPLPGRGRPMLDARAETIEGRARFAAGDRVFHDKFGYGRVRAVDGEKLEIEFEKAGTKKVIGSFVNAA
ncbi:MAG: DNA helicase II, partial [Alphaproteobacteria bacterium]